MEHQVEHQTSCRSRSDFTHPGEQSNAYETVTLLDDSLQGSNLDEQPFQSLIQPNATNEHHDNYQHAADMTTERTAPLTTDPPSTPLTSHDRSSSFINRRASPTLGYDFVIEDPTNPLGYREKRFRSRTELDKQKEDIRHLKEYGGACLACHRSKKKCGPSTPCPPCLAHDRKCVRKGQTDSQPNSSDPVPSPNPHQDELLEILQPCPWELTDSIDGTYCDPGFIQNSSRQGRTDR
ncbi:hypothetical protein N7466_004874 [Penicillium verhagenii]|uniref:uncharacterized protein n=1 Tax=Penicillium verhagenii TaxID=1562060 RepID=UPI0025451160|nr:uncharacterized protein N7466_004874 [Penicillium verhagenii]KAJ5935327.1 hypothetical protein N7466_004874 [Penicillium verhagenii]